MSDAWPWSDVHELAVGPSSTLQSRRARTFECVLRKLQCAAVRSHAETLRILKQIGLHDLLGLTSAHHLAPPAIIARTAVSVAMPRATAIGFMDPNSHAVLTEPLPRRSFKMSLHGRRQFEKHPAHRWLRDLLKTLSNSPVPSPDKAAAASRSFHGPAVLAVKADDRHVRRRVRSSCDPRKDGVQTSSWLTAH